MPPAAPPLASTPLQSSWTLYYDNPRETPTGDWLANLKLIATFSTVEGFWAAYNNVVPAGQAPLNGNFHLFKSGIKPMWEDESNKSGGKWILTCPKKDSREGKVDEWWLYTALALVGETLDVSGGEVCGAVVSCRKAADRLALWVGSTDEAAVTEVGKRWKVALEVGDRTVVKFQAHDDALKNQSSFKNENKFEC